MSELKNLVPFRRDHPPAQVLQRFSKAQRAVEALWRTNLEFREICRDYREAQAVLDRGDVTQNRTRDELGGLTAELEEEMVSLVDLYLSGE